MLSCPGAMLITGLSVAEMIDESVLWVNWKGNDCVYVEAVGLSLLVHPVKS